MKLRALWAIPIVFLAAAAPEAPAAKVTPVAKPYDESADAHAQVDAAFAEAKKTNRIVLLDFGGNWCPDCRILAGLLETKPVSDWVSSHFVEVRVDIGRRNKNMDISERFGVIVKGVPTVLMVTPDGKVLNPDDPYGLQDARSMSNQAVVDLLAKMAKEG